jgi:hypothetical protein
MYPANSKNRRTIWGALRIRNVSDNTVRFISGEFVDPVSGEQMSLDSPETIFAGSFAEYQIVTSRKRQKRVIGDTQNSPRGICTDSDTRTCQNATAGLVRNGAKSGRVPSLLGHDGRRIGRRWRCASSSACPVSCASGCNRQDPACSILVDQAVESGSSTRRGGLLLGLDLDRGHMP